MATTASELARAYDRYVAALWRGESEEVLRFGTWLKRCWGLGGPAEPVGPPDAVSVLDGAGMSIRWYERDGHVLGYIPGVAQRCYRVPSDVAPPSLPAYRGDVASARRRE